MHARVSSTFGQSIPAHFYGCTDADAMNYMYGAHAATVEDGSCIFSRRADGGSPCLVHTDERGDVFFHWSGELVVASAESVRAIEQMAFALPIPPQISNLPNFSRSNPEHWMPDPNAMSAAGRMEGCVLHRHRIRFGTVLKIAAPTMGCWLLDFAGMSALPGLRPRSAARPPTRRAYRGCRRLRRSFWCLTSIRRCLAQRFSSTVGARAGLGSGVSAVNAG